MSKEGPQPTDRAAGTSASAPLSADSTSKPSSSNIVAVRYCPFRPLTAVPTLNPARSPVLTAHALKGLGGWTRHRGVDAGPTAGTLRSTSLAEPRPAVEYKIAIPLFGTQAKPHELD